MRAERVLASAESPQGTVTATRSHLRLGGRPVAWEHVESASWDSEAGVLTVTEVGAFGQPRPVHRVELTEAARLLALVRERVTASVVLQRAFGFGRVIARRPPAGAGEIAWFVDYDPGADPADPAVAAAAEEALAAARAEIEV